MVSRVQLALRVSDLEGSINFYQSLFGVEPAKRRPGYANFAITQPPLKLVLIQGQPDQPTVMDHLGVEVETTTEVDAATARLSELGLFTQLEKGTTCCYALQDKVWVHGPGAEPWEVYTVKADAPRRPASTQLACHQPHQPNASAAAPRQKSPSAKPRPSATSSRTQEPALVT